LLAASASNTDCSAAFHQLAGFLPTALRHGDLYRVDLAAGETVDILAGDGNAIDIVMTLTDRVGNLLAYNDDDPAGSTKASKISYTSLVAATYVFEVSPHDAGVEGQYTLTVDIH